MTALSVLAPAKINLHLSVLGRRADGYHSLDSRFHAIGLYDHLTLEDGPQEVTFTCSEPSLAGSGNLAVRAAEALRRHTGVRRGVRIHLKKEIPSGAGLGGGSSDAAAVLVGLDRLWGLNLPPSELASIGADLGSDVPFFIYGGAARVGGRGEVVMPEKPLADTWCVLVFPGIHMDTRAVFLEYARTHASERLTAGLGATIITSTSSSANGEPTPGASPSEPDGEGRHAGPDGGKPQNDLQPLAIALAPEIGTALDALVLAGGVGPMMSGSGASVFCLSGSRETADQIRHRLQAKPDWRVWVLPLVSTGPVISPAGTAG
ncbi:MAG: 4-(cytidine 5'-diphospho)-2-C-methyl-D-erythritol kinase [Nitrospirota bacterium]|nr:4-(cytidine 5'-diphospho)-2-C-methyl-D-erythritol kinase [Nitrospirota bacterium]